MLKSKEEAQCRHEKLVGSSNHVDRHTIDGEILKLIILTQRGGLLLRLRIRGLIAVLVLMLGSGLSVCGGHLEDTIA